MASDHPMPTRSRTSLAALVACLVLASSCGGTPTTPPTPPASASIAATATTPPAPDRIDDLTVLATKDARVVVSLPNVDGLRARLDPGLWAGVEAATAHVFREIIDMPDDLAARLLGAYDGCLTFDTLGPGDTHGAIAVRLRDPSVIAPLVAAAGLEPIGPDRWKLGDIQVAWLAKAKVAILATDAATLDATLDRARGIGRDFAGSPLHQKRRPDEPWVSVDLAALGDAPPGPGDASRLLVWLDASEGIRVDYTHLGDDAPRLGDIVVPDELAALGDLPAGAGAALGVSIARGKGASVRDVVGAILGVLGIMGINGEGQRTIEASIVTTLGADLPELDRILGDELTIGFYPADGWPEKTDRLVQTGALLARIAVRDEASAKRLVATFATSLKKDVTGLKARPDGFDARMGEAAISVEARPDAILLSMGVPAVVSKVKASVRRPGPRLRDSGSFGMARRTAAAKTHALLFLDVDGLAKAGTVDLPELATLPDADMMLSLHVAPNPRGIDASFLAATGGPVSLGALIIGIVGSLGSAATRRHVLEAKTGEARGTLAAIGRSAVAAYEREGPSGKHALCAAAVPVPDDVPRGGNRAPNDVLGKGFDTGSATAGWRCLRFSLQTAHMFRYDYRVGKGYKGPARGGPNPGPNGFEISAEGDLDGDGKTSLFTLTGKVDAKTQSVKLDAEIFVADELE